MYDKAKACLTKFCVPMFCFPLMTSLSPTYDVTTAPFHQGELYAFHFPFHQLLIASSLEGTEGEEDSPPDGFNSTTSTPPPPSIK